MSDYESVPGLDLRVDDGVLRLTLDRPEVRNALNDEMVAAMSTAIELAGSDEAVRVIVLSAAGDHSAPASTSWPATRRAPLKRKRRAASSVGPCARRTGSSR
ncbi:MAG: enoyl-CoA hydratase/isomerase family protein [Acidimicrobiia bacterium]